MSGEGGTFLEGENSRAAPRLHETFKQSNTLGPWSGWPEEGEADGVKGLKLW